MAESIYLEATPVRLPSEVFRLYQYIVTDLNRSPGIIVEDGCTEFMFVKQPDIRLKIDGLDPVYVPRAFSAGKFTRPFKYEYRGEMNYFAVKLQPWTARHFIPEVLNGLIDLSTIYGPEIQDLSDEIFECASFEKMVQASEDFFSKVEMPTPSSYKLAMNVCRRVYASDGMVSIRELVSEFSESRQRINRDFLYHTRHSLKEFAVLVKIRAAIKFKAENPGISLTDLAHEFGYFDQSHFNRDMKKATGVTPTFFFSSQNFIKDQLQKMRA